MGTNSQSPDGSTVTVEVPRDTENSAQRAARKLDRQVATDDNVSAAAEGPARHLRVVRHRNVAAHLDFEVEIAGQGVVHGSVRGSGGDLRLDVDRPDIFTDPRDAHTVMAQAKDRPDVG